MDFTDESVNLGELIHRGGIYTDIDGNTPAEIYENLCKKIPLPNGMTPEAVYNALRSREEILSTAVGNGIALPHGRAPIMKHEEDQMICVVYLKKPLNMNAPDERPVYVMFVLLAYNSQIHLKVLSALAGLFHKTQFRKLLESKASESELINAINELS